LAADVEAVGDALLDDIDKAAWGGGSNHAGA
jgi:hypothetical protein